MSFQAGNAYITVTPSMRGFHRTAAREMQRGLPAAVVGTQSGVRRAAGRVGTTAGTAMVAGSSAVMGRNFTQAFQSAFGRSRAIADRSGRTAGQAFMVSTGAAAAGSSRSLQSRMMAPITGLSSRFGASGRAAGVAYATAASGVLSSRAPGVTSTVTRPFTGALSTIPALASATGVAYSNAAASSLGKRGSAVEQAVVQQFSKAVDRIPALANATGLSFATGASSSLTSRMGMVRNAVTRPFTGVMSSIPAMANATGLAYSGAMASSLAVGGTRAGQGFMGALGRTLGRGASAVTGAVAGIGARMSASLSAAGATAGTGFMAGFTRMIAPLAGVLSLAAILGSGFSRLADIEDAQMKFEGLGYSAEEVDQQMDSALESVEGTTIGLNEAADASVGAAAAGVEMGEDMTSWLTAIGDATAQSNVEYGHMAQMMNQVKGQGTVMLGDLRQMSQNGFEATAVLAEELGKTTGEIEDMASAGEITAEMFQEALENQIGGSAESMRHTVRGAVKEVVFQLGIAAAEFLETSGIFDAIRISANNIATFVESNLLPAISNAAEWLKSFIADVRDWARANEAWLKPLAVGLAGATAGVLAFVATRFLIRGVATAFLAVGRAIYGIPLVGWLAAAGAGLYAFFSYTEVGQRIWATVWGFIKDTTASFVDWFQTHVTPILSAAWDAIASAAIWAYENAILPAWKGIRRAASAFVDWWQATGWPAIRRGFEIIGDVAMSVWDNFLGPVIGWIWERLQGFAEWWTETGWPAIKDAWESFRDTVQDIWDNHLSGIFQSLRESFTRVKDTFVDLWNDHIEPMWQNFKDTVQGIWNGDGDGEGLKGIFGSIQEAWEDIRDTFRDVWDNHLEPIWQDFKEAVASFWEEHGHIFGWIAAGIAAIGAAPVILAITGVIGVILTLIGILYVVAEVAEIVSMIIAGEWEELEEKMAGRSTLIAESIGAVARSFVSLRRAAQREFAGVGAAYGSMAGSLMATTAHPIAEAFRGFSERLTRLVLDFGEQMTRIRSGFLSMSNRLGEIVRGAITSTFLTFRERALTLSSRFGTRMGEIISSFSGMASNLWSTVTGWITNTFSTFHQRVIGFRNNFASRMGEIMSNFGGMANSLWQRVSGPITNTFQLFRDRTTTLRNVFGDRMASIAGFFGDLRDNIRSIWGGIRSTLGLFGNYVRNTLVSRIRSAIGQITSIWDGLKAAFSAPVNWVIDEVINRGVIGTFNRVAKFIPGVSELPDVPNIRERAKGGYTPRGWTLVGEEGPELVNFSNPGRVYTADDTREALAGDLTRSNRDVTPEEEQKLGGRDDPNYPLPVGGWRSKLGEWLGGKAGEAANEGRNLVETVSGWALGNLRPMAEAMLRPAFTRLDNWIDGKGHMADLAGGMVVKLKDDILDWALGADDEHNASMFGGGGQGLSGMDAFLWALAQVESGNRNIANASGSSASGYWQIIDGTWGGYGGYSRAMNAPRDVQESRARQLISRYYRQYGNWEQTAAAWMYPALAGNRSAWGRSIGANPSIQTYVNRVMSAMRTAEAPAAGGGGSFVGGGMHRPSRGPVTSWFGAGRGRYPHSGIDIAGGGPVFAAYDGTVARTGWNLLTGRTGIGVLLNHGGGVQTYYGHAPPGGVRVSAGQSVSSGQRISTQGNTGNSRGVHVHFERLVNGRAQNINSMFRDKGGLIYPGMNQVLNETGGAEYVFNERQFRNLNQMAESSSGGPGAVYNVYAASTEPRPLVNELARFDRRKSRGGKYAGVGA